MDNKEMPGFKKQFLFLTITSVDLLFIYSGSANKLRRQGPPQVSVGLERKPSIWKPGRLFFFF